MVESPEPDAHSGAPGVDPGEPEPAGIIVDVDGPLGLDALQHPLWTLWSRFGSARDQRSVLGIGGVVRLIAREYPHTPVVYLTSAPPALSRYVRRALHMDGYPPGRLYAPRKTTLTWRGGGARHKRDVLRKVLSESARPWVLLGDDLGPDPALFAHAVARARVAAIALWHERRPDPGLVARVRERVPSVPVIAAPTGEGLVTQLARQLGLGRGQRIDDWFLTELERGNHATDVAAWTQGNEVRAIIDGRPYLAALGDAARAAGEGDAIFLSGWRGDAEQQLNDTTAGQELAAAARRGALVRGLVWRAHHKLIGFPGAQNRGFAHAVAAGGGRVLLDHRVRRFGSHHQKASIVRYRDSPSSDVAFVGGIDVAATRRDDEAHQGDPLTRSFAAVYSSRPAWHDVQLQITGPAVTDLERTFRERWADPNRLVRATWRIVVDAGHQALRRADPLPPMRSAAPGAGSCAVQLLRTYPRRRPAFPFAPDGERSIARAYAKALMRAQRLVYVEDQYLWSSDVARVFAAALERTPQLHVLAVVPRYPDQESPIKVPAARLGQGSAMDLVRQAGGDRVQVLNLEREDGTPIYVHDKICIIDDVWACVGSANLNRRSWTHDSELAAAVLDEQRDHRQPLDPAGLGDGARRFARDLRLALLREHLGRSALDDDDLIDPDQCAEVIRSAASALDQWQRGGRIGPRPPGRLRGHSIGPRPRWWTRVVTSAFYQTVFDPDGRPLGMRVRRTF